jgi:hypothetical protein
MKLFGWEGERVKGEGGDDDKDDDEDDERLC